jgi:hypothetical protein
LDNPEEVSEAPKCTFRTTSSLAILPRITNPKKAVSAAFFFKNRFAFSIRTNYGYEIDYTPKDCLPNRKSPKKSVKGA